MYYDARIHECQVSNVVITGQEGTTELSHATAPQATEEDVT